MSDTALLDASGVAKSFGAVRALTDASLHVARGEVVALMGANGAGKSTFVKILTGALKPDAGQVLIRGREARVGNPAQARASGLVPVYQEPSLIPDLDVADNLRLGGTPTEAFQHWVADLGITGLRLSDMIRDLPLATLRILDLARADSRVHDDPEPWVRVTNLGDSSVDLTARVWCDAADYWDIKFEMTKAVKEAFDKNGISIPYPHSVEIKKAG